MVESDRVDQLCIAERPADGYEAFPASEMTRKDSMNKQEDIYDPTLNE